MALILPPFRPKGLLRAAGQQAPSSGLAAFYSFASASDAWRDSVTGLAGTADANQSRVFTPDGIGLKYNGSARVVYTNFQNPAAVEGKWVTVVACMKLTTKPGTRCSAVNYGSSGGSGAFVGFDTSGFAIGGTFTTNGTVYVADAVDHTDQWITVGGSNDGSGSTGQSWVNGIYQGNNFSGGNVAGAAAQVNFGRDPTNYFGSFTGQIKWAAAFNRLLSNAEHMAMFRDPYGFCLGVNPNRRPFFGSAGGTVYNVSMTESASGADSPSSQGNHGVNDNETGSAVETISAQGTFPRTIAETATPADTVTNGATYSDSVNEAASGADTESAQMNMPVTVSESAPISEQVQNQGVFPGAVNESGSGADTQSNQGNLGNSDTESGSAVETIPTQAVFPRSILETAAAVEVVANTATLPSGIVENSPITDTDSATGPGQSDIVESAPISDSYSAQMIRPAGVTESAPISDTYLASLTLSLILAEVASASNSQTAALFAMAAVLETTPAADQTLTQLIAQIAVQELAAANDAYAQTGTVLVANWCNLLAGAPRVRILKGGCCP